jgi:hypothetical protein
MSKLISVLAQRPRHNTAQILSLHDIRELASDQVRSIPRPEEVSLLVPVVLATLLVIGLSVLGGTAPGVGDGDALASTVVGLTASLAEVVASATYDGLDGVPRRNIDEKNEKTYQLPYALQQDPSWHLVPSE